MKKLNKVFKWWSNVSVVSAHKESFRHTSRYCEIKFDNEQKSVDHINSSIAHYVKYHYHKEDELIYGRRYLKCLIFFDEVQVHTILSKWSTCKKGWFV